MMRKYVNLGCADNKSCILKAMFAFLLFSISFSGSECAVSERHRPGENCTVNGNVRGSNGKLSRNGNFSKYKECRRSELFTHKYGKPRLKESRDSTSLHRNKTKNKAIVYKTFGVT